MLTSPSLQYFGPDYELDVRSSNMENANSKDYLEKIKVQVLENLKRTAFAPSVQMTDVPRDPEGMDDAADALLDDLDEDENKDTRYTKRRWDKYVEKPGELSDSEAEEDTAKLGLRKQNGTPRRRNRVDHREGAVAEDDNAVGTPKSASQNGEKTTAGEIGVSTAWDINNPPDETARPADADEDVDMDMDTDSIQRPEEAAANDVVVPAADVPAAQVTTPPLSPTGTVEHNGAVPTSDRLSPSVPVQGKDVDANMDEGDTLDDSNVAAEQE